MAAKLKHQNMENSGGGNVVGLPSKCLAEDCSKKSEVQNFCKEHFNWFKFGLLTKEGKRPTDFDKKFQAYKKKAA